MVAPMIHYHAKLSCQMEENGEGNSLLSFDDLSPLTGSIGSLYRFKHSDDAGVNVPWPLPASTDNVTRTFIEKVSCS